MLKKASKFFQSYRNNETNGHEDGTEIPAVYKMPYFYGRISRKAAESILMKRSRKDGSYLLRESITPMGNFSLTMMHDGKCVHYSIEKQVDGQYMIMDGKKLSDPLEFIQYYSVNPGFVTSPKYPCERKHDEEAIAFTGISYNDLHNYMKQMARKMNANLLRALGPLRETLMIHVLRTMHKSMPWYHGEIGRDEAISRLQKSGLEDGKFILRSRNAGESYAITMCHEGAMRHYIISVRYGENFQIDNGPSFKALVILVDHYHSKRDGLACNLTMPCCEPTHKPQLWQNYRRLSLLYDRQSATATTEESPPVRPKSTSSPPDRLPPLPPVTRKGKVSDENPTGGLGGAHAMGVQTEGEELEVFDDPDDCEEENDKAAAMPGRAMSQAEAQELESVYLDIRTAVLSLKLKPENLKLTDKLGDGQFGEVMKGTCMLGLTQVPVAVKTLKDHDDTSGEKEIELEANLMKTLDHKHIVRMIGVCRSERIMLVMELAELGPLRKFLQCNKLTQLKQWHLMEIMLQICDGMQYLESKDVIHRDLATRNVLLLNEHFAKISDFGLSRMMDSDSNYYTAHERGKWPLMWYAPECFYYLKFDSKSDVWSFGVTMWEIMSYGARPYPRMKVAQITYFLESGNRMFKPKQCDPRLYQIILSCWEYKKERRPDFKQLMTQLQPLHREFRHLDV